MKSIPLRPAGHAIFLTDPKACIQSARISAGRAANPDLILLHSDIGRAILEKQTQYGWGESVAETLARDLRKAFPATTRYSVSSLWRMRQFYATHSSKEFLAQAVRELGGEDTSARDPAGDVCAIAGRQHSPYGVRPV